VDCRPYFVDSGAPGRGPFLGVVRADLPMNQMAIFLHQHHTRRLDRGGILPQQYLRQLGSMHRAMKSICYDDVRR